MTSLNTAEKPFTDWHCATCKAKMVIFPHTLLKYTQERVFTPVCGHDVRLGDENVGKAINWLTDNYPELLYPEYRKKGAKGFDTPTKPEPKKEAGISVEDAIKRIDEAIARWFPTSSSPE